jgi:hypothetical protein
MIIGVTDYNKGLLWYTHSKSDKSFFLNTDKMCTSTT